MSIKAPRWGGCPLGIALGAGFAISVVGCLLASATATLQVRLAVVAIAVAVSAVAVRNVFGAVLTAGIAWSLYLGFLVGQNGELSWHGWIDIERLGVLVLAALAGSAGWLVAEAHHHRPEFRAFSEIRSHGRPRARRADSRGLRGARPRG